MADFLEDLLSIRGNKSNQAGGDTAWALELYGAVIIEPTAFEPDPVTYRLDYYYNTVTNQLYKKVISRRGDYDEILAAHWHKVSN